MQPSVPRQHMGFPGKLLIGTPSALPQVTRVSPGALPLVESMKASVCSQGCSLGNCYTLLKGELFPSSFSIFSCAS